MKVWFIISAAIFVFGACRALLLFIADKRCKRFLNSVNVFAVFVFCSAAAMFVPIYGQMFPLDFMGCVKIALLSIHNAIRLFIVDGEFTVITDYFKGDTSFGATAFSTFAAGLFVLAPIMTFGVVLSFFRNISAYWHYFTGFFSDAYIFSELNDKSLTLAESIQKGKRPGLIVFTDVFTGNDEETYEMMERARALDAICFKKDILNIKFKRHSKRASISFFAIGEDESENIEQSLRLISDYRERKNTNLYVFASRADSDILLSSSDKGAIRVRRINEVRSLINRLLYDDGINIFKTAEDDGTGEKLISAVVIGLSPSGACMVKTLAWFCQMDGYRIEIDAFDKDADACDKFSATCPELMSERFNGVDVPGEARYKIRIHSGVDPDTFTFAEELSRIDRATYVFVALGSDEDNIRVSTYVRMLYERLGRRPMIQAIIRNSAVKDALTGIKNYRGQEYDIDFIGDLATSYSEDVIIDCELEEDALRRHMRWGDEDDFWKHEYNYRSSVASAMHKKAKILCGMPGIEKEIKDRTETELVGLRVLEHKRWNAYMRSEGYVFAPTRNDMAKTHPCLVPFDELPEKEKVKDDD